MIEVSMEDQEFLNPLLIDAEFLELAKQVWDDVAHASAYDHGSVVSLKEIDAGLLTA